MEADLQRYYQLDLVDWHRGRLSTRRLLVLVWALPPESAFMARLRGRKRISTAEELLMDIPEALTGKLHPRRQAEQDEKREAERAPKMAAARAKQAARLKKFGTPKL